MKRHGRARLRPSRGWRVGLASDGASPYLEPCYPAPRMACGICGLVYRLTIICETIHERIFLLPDYWLCRVW
jgi:hypothetical protein